MIGKKHNLAVIRMVVAAVVLVSTAIGATRAAAFASTCVAPIPGLVSWWSGEDNADDLFDGNDGVVNAVTFAFGKVGNAFDLDGSGANVRIPNSPSLSPPGSFSIEAWIFPRADHPGGGHIFSKWSTSGRVFNFAYFSPRTLLLQISQLGTGSDDISLVSVPNAAPLQAWTHVAAVYDQATGTMSLVANGTLVGQRTDPPIALFPGTSDITIGIMPEGANPFDGLIDEIKFYNQALTPAQVEAVFVADGAGTCTPAIQIDIDIKPASFPNSINVRSRGTVPVALHSTTGFVAPDDVESPSLTFGRTGDEPSLAFCHPEDVNADGVADLVCHFNTQLTGFRIGDTQGTLRGRMVSGTPLVGTDSVRIVPAR